MSNYYVAVDIGCIECGEASAVLGVFTDRQIAESVCEEHEKRQGDVWHGQHYFRVFEIPELNEVNRQEYAD